MATRFSGTMLPTELALANQVGRNRLLVRKANKTLEQANLVGLCGSERRQVNITGVYDAAPRAAHSLMLQQVNFADLWQVAMAMDAGVARLGAVPVSLSDFDRLAAKMDLLASHHKNTGSMQQQAQIDIEPHATVGRASGDRMLMLTREPIDHLCRPSLTRLQIALTQSERRGLKAFKHIFKAIAVRYFDQTQQCRREHLIDSQRGRILTKTQMNTPVETHRVGQAQSFPACFYPCLYPLQI